eukprot:COSAG01_NODE_1159_length_11469_cov_15.000352_1_plen_39_part_00
MKLSENSDLGKGAETLTSAIVGTPFLRSPEHAWRCDQR